MHAWLKEVCPMLTVCRKCAVSFVAGLISLSLVPAPATAISCRNADGWDLILQVLCVTFLTLHLAFHEAL